MGAVGEQQVLRTPPGPRDFVIFASAQLATFIGTWMQKTAVGWLAWEMTHSAAWVGAIALSDLFAALIVGPLAGAVIDRTNSYRLIRFTQFALIANALVLVAALSLSLVTPWFLLGWAIADACLQGFNQPVRLMIIGSLALPGKMGQVIAANSVSANLGRILGPAVAGVTLLYGSAAHVFAINIILYACMLGALRYLRGPIDQPRPLATKVSLRSDIVSGFRYVRDDTRMATVFVFVAAFSLLARPFAEMLPAIAGGVFDGGPGTLATLMIAQGGGALLAAGWLLMPREGAFLMRLGFVSGLGIGVALILFAFSAHLWFAIATIAIAGLFHVTCNICMQTTVQAISAVEMRGRTIALYMLLFRSAPALGAFILGILAEWFSLQHLIGVAAGLFLVVLLFLWPRARTAHGL